jgi:hypothetical protein
MPASENLHNSGLMQCSKDGTPSLLPSPKFLQRLENCSNEVLDRRLRQTELAADLLVALSLHHELQHIELLLGQAEAIADNLILDALALIERELRPALSTAEIWTNTSLPAPWG